MTKFDALESRSFRPDGEGLVANILRKGTPRRVYNIELGHDVPIREAIVKRFDLAAGLDRNDPDFERRSLIAFHRFCGLDYVKVNLTGMNFRFCGASTQDTAALPKDPEGRRSFVDESRGPITNWEEFEKYEWPDPSTPSATSDLEWFQKNTPDDMCLIGLTGHFCEFLSWLMGYETLCYALYDQRDLVRAVAQKIMDFHRVQTKRMLEFDRVRIIWGSDDMGFKNGTLVSPTDLREFVLPGHKELARMAHEAGRPYIMHSCGRLTAIMDDLIDDVRIDGKHSFEDTILDVRDAKKAYGRRVALLGGIDIDFLCRSDEQAVRRRVRDTLDVCMPGGGYCLGTGNSVANYVPVDNYLALVDEGMLYAPGR